MILSAIGGTEIAIIICGAIAVVLVAIAVVVAAVSRKRENKAERTENEGTSTVSASETVLPEEPDAIDSSETSEELSDAAEVTAEIPPAEDAEVAEEISEIPAEDIEEEQVTTAQPESESAETVKAEVAEEKAEETPAEVAVSAPEATEETPKPKRTRTKKPTETAATEETPKPKRTRTKKPTETAVTEEAPKPKRTRTKKPTETAATEETPKPKRTRTKKPTETAATEETPKPKRTRAKKQTANKPLAHRDVVTAAEAAEINDEEAKSAVKRERVAPRRRDGLRSIVNVDTLSQNFPSGGEVTLAALTEKKLVPQGTTYVKVLARGMLDKPLRVHADDFSLDAVKMIVVTGGQAITPERSGGSEA